MTFSKRTSGAIPRSGRANNTERSEVMDSAVVLLSGGMDSVTLLHYVKKRLKVSSIYALSFTYGQKHSRELEMAKWQAEAAGVMEHREIAISFFGDLAAGGSALTDISVAVPDLAELDQEQRRQPPTYVPNRNMVFLALAAAHAEAIGIHDVFYGAQTHDEYGYWDCTFDFVDRINAVLSLNRRRKVAVHAPFVKMTKAEVLQIGLELGVDYSHTWTCYRGGPAACGTCPSCVEREKAFREAGTEDPLRSLGSGRLLSPLGKVKARPRSRMNSRKKAQKAQGSVGFTPT